MSHALIATVADQPGMLFQLTKVFVDHQVNITHIDLHTAGGVSEIYFELTGGEAGLDRILDDLRSVSGVQRIEETPTLSRVYGKRIIVMGGGAQVGFVAMGAIAE